MIDDRESKRILLLVALDGENHLLIEDWVEVMSNSPRAVRLLAKRCYNERIHVEACPGQVRLRREIRDPRDLKVDDSHNIRVAIGKSIRILPSLLLQAFDAESPPALLGSLWFGGIFGIVTNILLELS